VGCLLLYELVCGEDHGEIYLVSNTLTQSGDAVFDACLSIVRNSPTLQARLKVIKSRGRIINNKTGSRLAVLSSTTSGLMGKDASCLAFDEISFFRDRRVYTNLKGSQLNRKQPLSLSITTASDNLEGIGKELYDYAVNVRDGKIIDPTFLPVIYEAPLSLDWRSEEAWRAANPSLGTLFQASDLRALAREAEAEPRKLSEFRQFHLNQWQHSSVCWLTKETWDKCADDFTEDDFAGRECFTGIDLARRHDMAAVVHVFPKDGNYYLVPRFFLPEQGIEKKEASDHAPYTTWARQGLLTLTPGDTTDYDVIRDVVRQDAGKFKIQECGFDPYSAGLLDQQLRMTDGINMVEVRQRIDLIAPACGQFEKAILDRRLRHNRHPILNWHAGNVSIRTDANGNLMPDKKHSKARFDGIMAAIIGMSRCITEDMGDCLILL